MVVASTCFGMAYPGGDVSRCNYKVLVLGLHVLLLPALSQCIDSRVPVFFLGISFIVFDAEVGSFVFIIALRSLYAPRDQVEIDHRRPFNPPRHVREDLAIFVEG
ncbi:hypothetical protein BDN72DRAFT_497781 [Pluteus cervinus]|uniref:Uncharacterized protein n=1 Tax=Pluteus cervinus TaxID=181527 RepID=A0ACD3A5E4_9AGAR|nr:hypothetical protein BDN72DRAFT_497781 [Pluteus cervinus]